MHTCIGPWHTGEGCPSHACTWCCASMQLSANSRRFVRLLLELLSLLVASHKQPTLMQSNMQPAHQRGLALQ